MATTDPAEQPAASPAGASRIAAFDTPTILSVATAHLVHDTYPAFIGVLLPLLIPRLGIDLAVAGLLAATFRVATGVQPILGYIADRADTRYWIIVAPGATAVAIGLLGVAPGVWSVALLLALAGVSSAVFHPAAAALVTRSSGTQWGRGTSIFMTGGESGRAVGPVLIAFVLSVGGLAASWIAMIPGVLASGFLYLRLAHRSTGHLQHPAGSIRDALRSARRGFLLLVASTALLSMATVGLLVFIPTYLTGAGADLVLAGAAVTVFEIGGAIGAFSGGTLSDRIGRRTMLALSVAVGAPLLIVALALPVGPLLARGAGIRRGRPAQRRAGPAGAHAGAAARQPRHGGWPEHLRDHHGQRAGHRGGGCPGPGDRPAGGADPGGRGGPACPPLHRAAAGDAPRERRRAVNRPTGTDGGQPAAATREPRVETVADQCDRVVALVREVLGEAVIGVYLHGSAVIGGLKPTSDLDLLVVANRSMTRDQRRELIRRLMPISGRGDPTGRSRSIGLEVVVQADVRPWAYPPRLELQYGDWWRAEFERGNFSPWESPNPDVALLLEVVLQANHPLFGPPPAEVLDPVPPADVRRAMLDSIPALLSYLDGDERNVVLTFARIWTTLATGTIRSKDAAADWSLPLLPPEHRPVLELARDMYRGDAPEEWAGLFPRIRPHVDHVIGEIRRAAAASAGT